MRDDAALKPDLDVIKVVLAGYSLSRVKFILSFVSSTIDKVKSGSAEVVDWPRIADELGMLDEVSKIIDAFSLSADEFCRKYPHLR